MITPTDTIKKKIGETVEINLKDGSSFKGKLITADDNLNLSLETQEGIKMFSGKNVSFVSF